ICMLLIDTARAFSINAKRALEAVKKNFPNLPLMVGNTCTPEGTKFLCEHGADIVKVGIGPGNGCTTRRTGMGIPQLSAIGRCAPIAKLYGKTIVGDGGIDGPGSIFKGLGAGASGLMVGRLLFGTEESAEEAKLVELKHHDIIEGEIKYKVYAGSASFSAQQKRVSRGEQSHINEPEGREVWVPVTCKIGERIQSQLRWLASAMSYRGMRNLKDLHEKFCFDLPQSAAGLKEGTKK
ncbi:MAG: IMP dehydrogenase, partial [bacterium]|nr:IMP dehydrogenase [bacterium]